MSGHSKWATIKHKKGAADKARGKLFAKLIRQVEVAARQGGGDIDMNPTLRTMYQKARSASVPARHHREGHQAGHRRPRGRHLRADHLRGLRPPRRGHPHRRAHRQPQPHRLRRAHRAQEERRLDRRAGRGGVAVRAQGHRDRARARWTRTTSCWPRSTPAPRTSPTRATPGGSPAPRPTSAPCEAALEAAGIAVESADTTMLPTSTVAARHARGGPLGAAGHRRARRERRRAGRLRQLRHPRRRSWSHSPADRARPGSTCEVRHRPVRRRLSKRRASPNRSRRSARSVRPLGDDVSADAVPSKRHDDGIATTSDLPIVVEEHARSTMRDELGPAIIELGPDVEEHSLTGERRPRSTWRRCTRSAAGQVSVLEADAIDDVRVSHVGVAARAPTSDGSRRWTASRPASPDRGLMAPPSDLVIDRRRAQWTVWRVTGAIQSR